MDVHPTKNVSIGIDPYPSNANFEWVHVSSPFAIAAIDIPVHELCTEWVGTEPQSDAGFAFVTLQPQITTQGEWQKNGTSLQNRIVFSIHHKRPVFPIDIQIFTRYGFV